jgi:hypothetical protein
MVAAAAEPRDAARILVMMRTPQLHWEVVMDRSRIVVLAAAALLVGADAGYAGPCTTQIAQLEQQVDRPGPDTGPTATQTVDAQLHHQPTPGTVRKATSQADADAAAALQRARQADADGNASACSKALDEARLLYGID